MRKILAIGGRPGTGKTTLMRAFMKQADDWERVKPAALVDGEYSKTLNLLIIGKYDEGEVFAGTDKLSMAVQPKALEYIVSQPDIRVIFEGDRLFNGSFVRDLMSLTQTELKVFLLTVTEKNLRDRYEERGTDQDQKFLDSRKSKYDNMMMSFDLMDVIQERQNIDYEAQKLTIDEICDFFNI